MAAMKVLHVIESMGVGGAERVVANYIKYHDRAQFHPQVCTLKQGGETADELRARQVTVHSLHKKDGLDLHVLTALRRVIHDEGIRIVHLHNPPANNWGVPATLLNRHVVNVRTEHNVFYRGRIMPGYPLINMLLGYFNDRILAVSDQVRISHMGKDPLCRRKYRTVYNGIDSEIYGKPCDGSVLRNELGLLEGSRIIGVVASLTKQKRLDLFLHSVRLLVQKHPDLSALIIGDGTLKGELATLSTSMGLANTVRFLGNRKDVPRLMQLMNVFVLSSDWEGLPMTIIEAMASRTPCVVTDVGGNREAVLDGQTGFLVPPRDPEAMAGKIAELLEDADLAAHFGEGGFQRFQMMFTASGMVTKTEQIYREVLAEKQ